MKNVVGVSQSLKKRDSVTLVVLESSAIEKGPSNAISVRQALFKRDFSVRVASHVGMVQLQSGLAILGAEKLGSPVLEGSSRMTRETVGLARKVIVST